MRQKVPIVQTQRQLTQKQQVDAAKEALEKRFIMHQADLRIQSLNKQTEKQLQMQRRSCQRVLYNRSTNANERF